MVAENEGRGTSGHAETWHIKIYSLRRFKVVEIVNVCRTVAVVSLL
jgi:hypothetical protein